MKRSILGSTPMSYSNIVVKAVFDGDINTKMKEVPYSTDARSIFTVGDMVKIHEMGYGE